MEDSKVTFNAKTTRNCSSVSTINFEQLHLVALCPVHFFNCYLTVPRPTLGHYRGGSLTHPMLITAL